MAYTFLAHFCLCQVHYLGIIFSGLVGLSYLISNKKKPTVHRIPFPISTVWIFTLPIYLLLLSQQSSHLGNWPKPNELSDLLASYTDSILILTILIPIIAIFITIKSKRNIETQLIEDTGCSRSIMITSLLWFSVPLLFWILSHLTSLNLFVDRYFIPKETAIIFLVAYGFSFILQKLLQQKSKNISIYSTLALAIMLLLMSTKKSRIWIE